jgi:hypothetical protein
MWVFRTHKQKLDKKHSFQRCVPFVFCNFKLYVGMGDGDKGCGNQDVLAVCNGYRFKLNDLVDVFVGTGPNIRDKRDSS